MSEIIRCPRCERQLNVPDSLQGKLVKCPSCGETFTAGGSPAAAEEPLTVEALEGPAGTAHSYQRDRADDGYNYRRDVAPHRGTAILVLGILSLVACGLLGPVAWIMGNTDLAEIRAGRMDRSGEGNTQAGRICGMIATILMGVGLGFWCILFIIAMAGAGHGHFR